MATLQDEHVILLEENDNEELSGAVENLASTPDEESTQTDDVNQSGAVQTVETVVPESGKKKKKEDRSYEYILRALSSLQTPEEKLAALCKKYAELYEDNRVQKEKLKQTQKKLTMTTREKDHLQTEHSKVVLAKSRLETLSRELQRQNKTVKEESLARTKAEEEKRKEVTTKFTTTITDIQAQMTEYHGKNAQLRDENQSLAEKLKKFIEQYEQQQKHTEKLIKTKELEAQLAEAKMTQSGYQLEEQKARSAHEQAKMTEEIELYQKRVEMLESMETKLREQIEYYKKKYEEFHTTLTQSNDVFASCKAEMQKMSKRLKKMEKEALHWKQKWENSSQSVILLADEKAKNEQLLLLLNTKVKKLEGLCRALQTERVQLLKKAGDSTATPNSDVEAQIAAYDCPPKEIEASCNEETLPSGANQVESACNNEDSQPSGACGGETTDSLPPATECAIPSSQPISLDTAAESPTAIQTESGPTEEVSTEPSPCPQEDSSAAPQDCA